MDWVFEHLRLVIFAVIVIGALIKQRANAQKKKEEELRQFERERLRRQQQPAQQVAPSYQKGQSVSRSQPPPLRVEPEPVRQQRAKKSPPPLAAPEIDPALARQLEMEERLRLFKAEKATRKSTPSSRKKKSAPAVTQSQVSLHQTLADPQQIRNAMVLREILGPPVGLR